MEKFFLGILIFGMEVSNRKFIKFIWDSLAKYKYKLFLLYFLAFIFLYLIPSYALPYILKLIGDLYISKTLSVNNALLLVLIYALLYSSGFFVAATILRKLHYRTEVQVENDVRTNLFNYTIQHSINYFNNVMSGTIANKINIVSNAILPFLTTLSNVISDFILLIILVVIYSKLSWFLFGFFIVWFFVFLSFNYFVMNKLNKIVAYVTKITNDTSGYINDDLMNILNIKLFSKQKKELMEIRKKGMLILSEEYKLAKFLNLSNTIFFILIFLLIFGVFGVGFYMVYKKEITLGTFLFLCQSIIILRSTLDNLISNVFDSLQSGSEIKESIFTIIQPIEIKNNPDSTNLKNIEGGIVFKDLGFSYKK